MMIKNRLSNKATGFYIAAAAAVVGLVATIMYIVFMSRVNVASQQNPWVLVTLIIGILTVLSLLFVDDKWSDIISMGAIVIFALSLGIGLQDAIFNLVDLLQGIKMFGDADVAMLNVNIIVAEVLAIVLLTISCFFKNEKETE
jgi:hypothetical protein